MINVKSIDPMDGVESGRGVVRLPLLPILTLIFLEEGEGGGGLLMPATNLNSSQFQTI